MTQLTEGTWEAEPGWGGDNDAYSVSAYQHYDDGTLRSFCTVAVCDTRHPRHDKANAHLIAASPELFAACQLFLTLYLTGQIDDNPMTRDVYAIAVDAVAKVTDYLAEDEE